MSGNPMRIEPFEPKKRKNLFKDDKRLFKEDREFDKKFPIKRTNTRRPLSKKVTITCDYCGKKEKISPILVPPSESKYKCKRCLGE